LAAVQHFPKAILLKGSAPIKESVRNFYNFIVLSCPVLVNYFIYQLLVYSGMVIAFILKNKTRKSK